MYIETPIGWNLYYRFGQYQAVGCNNKHVGFKRAQHVLSFAVTQACRLYNLYSSLGCHLLDSISTHFSTAPRGTIGLREYRFGFERRLQQVGQDAGGKFGATGKHGF